MELYDHFLDSISFPQCIKVDDNLWALRFESMKLLSCSTAVDRLLKNGIISEGTVLVDSSSGIYAYALALTSHKYQIKCHIIASTTVDETLLLQLRALGATVDQVPSSTNLKYDQELRVKKVNEYLKTHPNAYWMRQYHDHIHYEGYKLVGEQVANLAMNTGSFKSVNLVVPVGSGASSAGIYEGLRGNAIDVHLSGVQPFGSVSFGSEKIADPDILVAGIGSAIHFENINYDIFNTIHWISAAIARYGTVQLLSETGIFAGLSSGASYTVAKYVSRFDCDELTLCICPDMGYRYAPLLTVDDQISSTHIEPIWIDDLDDLKLDWCVMNWSGEIKDRIQKG